MLIAAGIKTSESTYGFEPVNQLAAEVFELWQLLRHQVIIDFGVPIALNISTVFRVLDEYGIHNDRIWYFETIIAMSEKLFAASAESLKHARDKTQDISR